MSFRKNKKKNLFTEINITPLTDIFLVLLIIMMVIAPSFQSNDSTVDMPEISNGINIEESLVTVSITKDGVTYVNDDSVSKSQLTDKLIAVKPKVDSPEVIVKADKNVKSSVIMDIMDAAQNAEYKKLVVAGQPLSQKEQNTLKQNGSSQVEILGDD